MNRLMPQTVDWPGPVYIRVAKGYDPIVTSDDNDTQIGKAIWMRRGSDALIITTGITLQIGLEAAEKLEARGISAGVLHNHTLKPIDGGAILEGISGADMVVTAEEHTVIGGLGSIVAELMVESDMKQMPTLKRIGIPDTFAEGYGSQATLMEKYGITADGICAAVISGLHKESIN
jgi:transketolase